MKRGLAAGLLILALAVCGPVRAQTPTPVTTGVLQARIADTLGAAIDRAFVLVHGYGRVGNVWVKVDQQVDVNINGEFQIQLAPGLYDLFVGSPGFIPYAKKVKIQPGKPTVLKIKLQVDMDNLQD
jgi:hypothetical protein